MLQPVTFSTFGGLRLDQALDEVGGESAIFLRDVDWDGSLGKIRSRDGFQKLKEAEATGTYKALFPHSSLRLLATKRVSSESLKLVAIDREGTEKTEATLKSTAAKSCFARYGTPSASYTYMRTNTSEQKVVRFDGSSFTEPTATVGGEGSKEMPKAALMVAWPDGGNRMVYANTGSEGGPNKLASSNSHVWFSEAGSAEKFETTAYVQLSPGDGEEITALTVWGGRVYVFKETKFFVFYEPATDTAGKPVFSFYEVTLGEGSRMKRASSELLAETSDQIATSAPDGVYFCTTDGIYWSTGNAPAKISDALKPLEETTPFDGPMADFLNGSSESFRWPATGIASLGKRLIVRRYEFMFVYDIPTDAWTCWKMPAVSMAVWTGLTGGGTEASQKSPGKGENDSSVGDKAWSNPENIKSSDNSRATAALNSLTAETSQYLVAKEFGFSLSSEATPVGIVASVERSTSEAAGEVEETNVRIVKGGTRGETNKALEGAPARWTPTETTVQYGGSEDLWGETWAYSDINSSGFGLAIRARCPSGSREARVDHVTLTVYYTLPSATGGVRPRLFCTQSKHVYWTGPTADDDAATREPNWQSGFYDLEAADEKVLREMYVMGTGDVEVSVAEDFGEVGSATTFELGESISKRQKNKSQNAVLFSHRLSGDAPWSVQRLARYAEVERVPASDTP